MSTWSKLSKIDVSGHIEKKGSLSYLSWAWAWGALMEQCPDSVYSFQDNEVHADGSVTVHCTLTVDGITREMWLPVMNNRNQAILSPTSRDISDAKMRCLVKAIAMFGLGHFIYAGEDLPAPSKQEKPGAVSEKQEKPEYTAAQIEQNRDKWVKLLDSKKTTPDAIISRIQKQYFISEGLQQDIKNLEAPF